MSPAFQSSATDLAGKRVELLREVLPGLRHLAIMGEATYRQPWPKCVEVEAAARTLGLTSSQSRSIASTISHPPWPRSTAMRMHSMSAQTLS